MSKKQTNRFNFISLFLFSLFCLINQGFSQDKNTKLSVADSLFEQKKYTESFNVYEKILNETEQASPRMFLRMAFIKEGLGNYSEALYYLNKYYLKTSDKHAQSKMKEVAESNDLSGFDINDKTFFIRQIRTHYDDITIGLFIIVLVAFGLVVYKKYKLYQRPMFEGLVLVILLSGLFYFINYGSSSNEGIIIENHAYIMSGPSAGSNLLEVVQSGHKIKILDENHLWMAIEWNGQKGYIRKTKVKKFS